MLKPTVVNVSKSKKYVFVGRPTKWGNPFKIPRDGDRDEVIRKYREWILTQPELLAELPSLAGKELGCYCSPKPCHADILAELVEAL